MRHHSILKLSSAHASAAPWEGQNALDAAFLAYSAVSVLRQQIRPDHRVHGIVEGRNWAPNSKQSNLRLSLDAYSPQLFRTMQK